MDTIRFTLDSMRGTANEVDNLADEYSNKYQTFFNEIETLTSTDWKGVDATAFKDQVEGFRDDFGKMKQLMNDYASFIRQAAANYETTQNNLKSQAQSLKN